VLAYLLLRGCPVRRSSPRIVRCPCHVALERGKSFQRDRPIRERRKNVEGGPRRTLPRTTTPMPTNWRERGKSFQRDQPIRERGKNLFPATVHSARTRVYSCSIRDMQFCVSLVQRVRKKKITFLHPELTKLQNLDW